MNLLERFGWVRKKAADKLAGELRSELISALASNTELRTLLREKDDRIETHVTAHEQTKSEHRKLVEHHEKAKKGAAVLSEAVLRLQRAQSVNMAELNGRFK